MSSELNTPEGPTMLGDDAFEEATHVGPAPVALAADTADGEVDANAAPVVAVPERTHDELIGLPLGEIMVRLFDVPVSAIGHALDAQAGGSLRLGELLVSADDATDAQVQQALAVQLDLPYMDAFKPDEIPDAILHAIPITFAKSAGVLCLGHGEDGSVVAAVTDPLNTASLDELRLLLDEELDIVVTTEKALRDAINRSYDRVSGHAATAMEGLDDGDEHNLEGDIVDLLDADDDDAPIIRLVNSLLSQSVKDRASDIHIEPFEREMLVRFRIDGVLEEIVRPPKRAMSAIISRIKIMAGLNIAEKRLPQDGRIRLKVAGKDIDIRVSTVPTTYGERIVMRLLDRSSVLRDLGTIGLTPKNLAIVNQLISKSHGIILVTGPTGSGKTSTLYGCLARINKPDLNILTVEDPVEYQLAGIGQVQVNSAIDLTFASGLRAFLRQDPDVIMVGEIRDRETAEIAIQASLTGHLVLSTVHTNDAAGAVSRLVDMNIEPFLVASSLVGVMAQRLVRTICKHCKESYQPSREELAEIGITDANVTTAYRGKGCPKCKNTGYSGRLGIFEMMLVDEEIRQLILKNVDAGTIKSLARKKGMYTLREDGAQKVIDGLTTIAEVTRVTQEDSMALDAFA